MIVLGPMDAELSGAPDYWRRGNWRPYTLTSPPPMCAMATIPFDQCTMVMEYDARDTSNGPLPSDQGWTFNGDSIAGWSHDAALGVLRFALADGSRSYWEREDVVPEPPPRAVGYSVFNIELAGQERRDFGGLDFRIEAGFSDGVNQSRGMRGGWTRNWLYAPLDSESAARPVIQPSAEPEMLNTWHRMALDAELVGPPVAIEGVDSDDGGKTIGSLDGLVNNDDRYLFRYGQGVVPPVVRAQFGVTDDLSLGPIQGVLCNFYTSFPGRFVRAGFKVVAPGPTVRLRFVFSVPPEPNFVADTAVFLVRYDFGDSLRPAALPTRELPRLNLNVDGSTIGRTIEVSERISGLAAGAPVWFTLERDWQNENDRLRSTAHLLMVIVEQG